MSSPSQAERLARIETLLEESVLREIEELKAEVREDMASIKSRLDKAEKDFASAKNRGAGILVGVAFAFALVGLTASDIFKWFANLGS